MQPPETSATARQKKQKLKIIKHQIMKAMLLHSQALSSSEVVDDSPQKPPQIVLHKSPTSIPLGKKSNQPSSMNLNHKMHSTNNLLNISSYHLQNQDLAASFQATQTPSTHRRKQLPPALAAERVLNTTQNTFKLGETAEDGTVLFKMSDSLDEDIDGKLTMELHDQSGPVLLLEDQIVSHQTHLKSKNAIDLHPWGLEHPKLTHSVVKAPPPQLSKKETKKHLTTHGPFYLS